MAGFGIFMTILYMGVIGLAAAVVIGAITSAAARKWIPSSAPSYKAFLRMCWLGPFVGLLWIFLVFHTYSRINESVFHRDDGLSVNPHTPMPNGYILGSVDYHEGYIICPGMQMNEFPHDAQCIIAQVLKLQVDGPFILGDKFLWPSVKTAYFLFDTRDKSVTQFATLDELKTAAAAHGITVHLEDMWVVYERYHRTWFDTFAVAVGVAGILLLLGSFFLWARKLRRSQPPLIRSVTETQSR